MSFFPPTTVTSTKGDNDIRMLAAASPFTKGLFHTGPAVCVVAVRGSTASGFQYPHPFVEPYRITRAPVQS